jgi:hypothetical protein
VETLSDTRSNGGTKVAPDATPAVSRQIRLATKAAELLAERDRWLPVWIRSPKSGPEHYSGFSRAKLYELAGGGKIRSVSIREPGQVKGVRLFHLGSILDFVARCEAAAGAQETTAAPADAQTEGARG